MAAPRLTLRAALARQGLIEPIQTDAAATAVAAVGSLQALFEQG